MATLLKLYKYLHLHHLATTISETASHHLINKNWAAETLKTQEPLMWQTGHVVLVTNELQIGPHIHLRAENISTGKIYTSIFRVQKAKNEHSG
jgi:hypothetical protein